MTIPKLSSLSQRVACVVVPLLLAWSPISNAQAPAQLPLLSRAGVGVQPNIMLLMDDSGSMAFRHMPEYVFASDTFVTNNPVGSGTVIWDPLDRYQASATERVIPGSLTVTNWVLRAMRSSDTNTLYYNPTLVYLPWFNDDGVTRRPNSPVTTAYLNPPLKATTATSTTSLTVGTGGKTFTLAQAGKSFAVGDRVVISSTATPNTQWMYGNITAFNAASGLTTVNVTQNTGSSSLASWNVVKSDFINLTTSSVLPGGTFGSPAVVAGLRYRIMTSGNTNWTAIGAGNNNVGTVFTATGPRAGTGTAAVYGLCFANPTNVSGVGSGAGQGCEPASGPFTHDPGVYFQLQKTGVVYKPLTNASNYTPYSINVGTSFPKVLARTDCSGAVGPTGCTQAEERQNFANWYTYYRTRNLLARGGMMEAFAADAATVTAGAFVANGKYRIATVGTTSFTSIGAAANTVGTVFTATGAGSGSGTAIPVTYRMGFGSLNNGAATVDTVATIAIEGSSTYGTGGVRDYTDARRINLFRWLEDLPASGGTPLVPAFEAIGDYYKRTDSRGPWTDNPGSVNTVANNKTCRRSYQIAMTDGYWNTTAGTKGNADATATGPITGVGTSYPGYTPGPPYSDSTANTLADSAMHYWVTDLQPSTDNAVKPLGKNISFWQNMTAYTVSMGVRGNRDPAVDLPALSLPTGAPGAKVWPPAGVSQTTNNVDDLWHAAVNSRGEYFSIKDPKQLSDSIKSILTAATGNDAPTAGVATASTTLTDNNFKYVPKFVQQGWSGDLEAYRLSGVNGAGVVWWNAASKMPSQSAKGAPIFTSGRNIVTWDSGSNTAVPFKWASLSTANKSALGTVAATHTTRFVDYLWGEHTYEGSGEPFRQRLDKDNVPFVLGDFMNGNPVAVLDSFNGQYGNLNLGVVASSSNPAYADFLLAKKARTSVVFAGANDGMLHGFKDSRPAPTVLVPAADDGREVFAYVPRAVYSNLYKLTDKTYGTTALPHQYFVDGPLRESDAYVKAPSAGSATWRNYLMGSLGAGGRGVYALDVTDLANLGVNTVRWELSDVTHPELGYVLSPIKVGVLANGQWVAIFGNGFSSTGGKATLFVVDIEKAGAQDPSAVQKLDVDTSGSNGLGGVTLVHDVDGKVTTIYAGDLKGKMWKFDYSASAASNFEVSGGTALFSATDSVGAAQPITASPVVYNHAQGGKIVIFGTGKLFSDADALDTSVQTTYAVWDKTADVAFSRPMVRANLTGRTLNAFKGTGSAASTTFFGITDVATIDWTVSRGWRIDLQVTLPLELGQTVATVLQPRVVYPALVAGFDTALISTVAPAQGVLGVCDSLTGSALNLLLPVQSGLNPTNKTFDTHGSGSASGGDAFAVGYSTAADGVDVVVRSSNVDGSDGINDPGGGGHEGDCTGAKCSGGGECKPSPLCPEPGTCLASIQSATAGIAVCVPSGAAVTRKMDRVWRRIINPPIR